MEEAYTKLNDYYRLVAHGGPEFEYLQSLSVTTNRKDDADYICYFATSLLLVQVAKEIKFLGVWPFYEPE